VLLLAQAGVPFTTGFDAKFGIITAATAANEYVLAIAAMVASVISMFLYLRVVVVMYVSEPTEAEARTRIRVSLSTGLAIVVAAVFTVESGVFPGSLFDFARDSVAHITLP
jgi:NADH-quinone oxidoreductase subunit N